MGIGKVIGLRKTNEPANGSNNVVKDNPNPYISLGNIISKMDNYITYIVYILA